MSSRKMEAVTSENACLGSAGLVGAPGLLLGDLTRPPVFR
jgi:hypothetical protein